MNNPVNVYNIMISYLENKDFINALRYAEELDNIIGYNYYVYYVNDKQAKFELERDKCLQQYNELVRVRKNDNENN